MKRKIIVLAAALGVFLSGCGWFHGSYVSVTPHEVPRQSTHIDSIHASSFQELLDALTEIVSSGTEVAAIHVGDYPEASLEPGIQRAIYNMKSYNPIGAYAVEDILYEIGTSSGQPAVSVTVRYRHNATELQTIRRTAQIQQAQNLVAAALENYEPGIVLWVENYENTDFVQFVEDYAWNHPQTVMEVPQVTLALYGVGKSRVVEVVFTYQTSRETLRRMQGQVKPVFEAAELYVSGDGDDSQKYSQLYAFLMERFDYKLETSITPAYSLLRHGIGDSRVFAQVYAAMCREAGLNCVTVTGTRNAEPWTWNIVQTGEEYYHVDLLACNENGRYRQCTDAQMEGYVWDYSEYPVSKGNAGEQTDRPS